MKKQPLILGCAKFISLFSKGTTFLDIRRPSGFHRRDRPLGGVAWQTSRGRKRWLGSQTMGCKWDLVWPDILWCFVYTKSGGLKLFELIFVKCLIIPNWKTHNDTTNQTILQMYGPTPMQITGMMTIADYPEMKSCKRSVAKQVVAELQLTNIISYQMLNACSWEPAGCQIKPPAMHMLACLESGSSQRFCNGDRAFQRYAFSNRTKVQVKDTGAHWSPSKWTCDMYIIQFNMDSPALCNYLETFGQSIVQLLMTASSTFLRGAMQRTSNLGSDPITVGSLFKHQQNLSHLHLLTFGVDGNTQTLGFSTSWKQQLSFQPSQLNGLLKQLSRFWRLLTSK